MTTQQLDMFAAPATPEPMHDPGGKRRIRLGGDVIGTAVFGGPRKEYRYSLARLWNADLPSVLFVMMNPSTADPSLDDPTVAKCGRYARRWGYGRLLIGNTFAYRATDQDRLLEVNDPVGPENNLNLMAMAEISDLVVFAYGTPRRQQLRPRGLEVVEMLRRAGAKPHVLRLSGGGRPVHPLYLSEDLKPHPWEPTP